MSILLFASLLLAFNSATAQFPAGRCYVKSCLSTPYNISVSVTEPKKFCVRIVPKECQETNSQYKCCDGFLKDLHKIVISANGKCNKSIDYVTIDNVRKAGGVFFDVYPTHSELRLTTLRMNATTAQNKEICVYLKNNCEPFCVNDDNGCKVSVYDPISHTCCPTCDAVPVLAPPPKVMPAPAPSPVTPKPAPSPVTPKPAPSPVSPKPASAMNCSCICSFLS
jgi:hypothetical protein